MDLGERIRPFKGGEKGTYHWYGMVIKKSAYFPRRWAVWYNYRDIYWDNIRTLKDAMRIIQDKDSKKHLEVFQELGN